MHNEIPAFLKLDINAFPQLAQPASLRPGKAAQPLAEPDANREPIVAKRIDVASGLRLKRAADRIDSGSQPISVSAGDAALTAGAASGGRIIAEGDNATLLTIWQISWRGIEGTQDATELGTQLLAAYRDHKRVYHSARHLIDCLNLWEDWVEEADRAHEVAVALWFHDAIYDTERHDSEARSARWALDALSSGGVPFDTVRRIRDLVIATRANESPNNDDARLIIDIDQAILGAPAPRYDEYEAQLQSEHPQVADFIYRRKRLDILRSILVRPRIFHTLPARKALEAQARENLARTIARLQERTPVAPAARV